jgi:PAS domain S-box-containing protein
MPSGGSRFFSMAFRVSSIFTSLFSSLFSYLGQAAKTITRADDKRPALPHTEETYRWLFENSVDGIYVTTPAGQLLNANPALARMMGYATPQDLIDAADDIAEMVYVDRGVRAEYLRRMERDGIVREFEYRVRRRNGDMLWLSDSAAAVRDNAGTIIRYEGTVRDITAQKSAEAALAESRQHLQEVIDTVPAVINVKNTDLRYVLMNRYMSAIFDIEPVDALGRTTSEIMSRYGAAKTDDNDRRVLNGKKELGFYEEEYLDSKGISRQWMANKVPIFDADGNISFIVTVALDIGDRKRVEQEMRQARDAAETALRDLKETQNSLVEAEKLAALGRLVAGVAHEVNNPVGISLTVASSLQRQARLFTEEAERGTLRKSSLTNFLKMTSDAATQLMDNLNRAAELIQSFKQVATDRNFSDRREFDIRELTEQIITSLRPGLRRQNLSLAVECEPDLVLNSYPGSYGQILTNLFLNAVIHAFPEGQPGQIDVKVRAAGHDGVEILFADNGRGMSPEVRRHAFDPFFTTRRNQGGTGLGLHIVYNIVTNRLGGRIGLESTSGAGTQIQIVLPRVAPFDRAAE